MSAAAQPNLFGEEPPVRELGRRQQLVLDRLREGGLTDDEAGALVHAARGKHPDDIRCDYCAREGRGVLSSLRKRGLAVRRRTSIWEAIGAKAPATGQGETPRDQGEIPW